MFFTHPALAVLLAFAILGDAGLARAEEAHPDEGMNAPAQGNASMDMMNGMHTEHGASGHHGGGHSHARPDAHAPIGVMADHGHSKNGVMLAYRIMHMEMGGNQLGTEGISGESIVTGIPNRFSGVSGQPGTLRVVPRNMNMDMHMVGVMYAPVDAVTIMVTGSYVMKEMDHRTYQGASGTNVAGTFQTAADGIGDMTVSGIVPLLHGGPDVNLRLGLSLPTGSTTRMDTVLTPMMTQARQRLPYAMQIGSGTWDILAGSTVTGHSGKAGWGAQYLATIRTGHNDQGYRLGDSHLLTAWGSYQVAPWSSLSLRAAGQTTGRITGMDPEIVAPVQTADPDNYGGQRLDLYLGTNLLATGGGLKGYRLGLEFGLPVYQDFHGLQLKTKWSFMAGIQKAF